MRGQHEPGSSGHRRRAREPDELDPTNPRDALSFVFLDMGVWLAVIGVVRLLPFVSVQWWSAGTVLAAAIVTWVVLVFERPPRPGFGRR